MSDTVAQQNLEAEESVLGAMMMTRRAIEEATETLRAEDFYRESYGKMFTVMSEMYDRSQSVDTLTLVNELEQRGLIDQAGGKAKIIEIAAIVPSASNVGHYANIVREKAILRRLSYAGFEIKKLGDAGVGSPEDIRDRAETLLTDALTMAEFTSAQPMDEGLDEWLAELRVAFETGNPIRGQQTGIGTLDSALGGFWPGQLLIAAARPAMGKTTLALNMADNIVDMQKDVLFVSMEMSRNELRIRSLAREAKIDSLRLQAGLLNPDEAKRLGSAVPVLRERAKRFHIHDEGLITLSTIRAEANRLKRRGDLGAVFVDYIQLMTPPTMAAQATRAEQIGAISRGLKQLAQRLNIPVVALSQMNRAIEQRHNKRPTLSDLRDSGTLEQDADVVMFLHDDAEYDIDKKKDGNIEIIIGKARRGSTISDFKLKYDKPLNTFGVSLV